jgi:uncharacterized RDD family membrane protein YckC
LAATVVGNLAMAPDWRSEVAQRLEAHRLRRRRLCPDEQPALPFEGIARLCTLEEEQPRSAPLPRPPIRARRQNRLERMEIDLAQPLLDFSGDERKDTPRRQETLTACVGSLQNRRRAGFMDVGLLLAAFSGFFGLFLTLGGQWGSSKLDIAVTVGAFILLYALYFTLFTLCGATPGMRWCGLRVVSFDGAAPAAEQLWWRSFGYLVSGGTLMLGFLWAACDDEHLSWHDRISQTCLAPADAANASDAIEVNS